MTLENLYVQYNQALAHKSFTEAESLMQEILQIEGQPWQQYLYLPADFYETWGNYLTPAAEANFYYQKALEYRYQIGSYATGSGEGMEAMYHIKRIQKKMKTQENQ